MPHCIFRRTDGSLFKSEFINHPPRVVRFPVTVANSFVADKQNDEQFLSSMGISPAFDFGECPLKFPCVTFVLANWYLPIGTLLYIEDYDLIEGFPGISS